MIRLNRKVTVFAIGITAMAAIGVRLQSASDVVYTSREKAAYAPKDLVAFVRPGLTIRVLSAEIASDGTISTTFTITDPRGVPLDRTGVTTPGAVSLNFVAARIPRGQSQYVAYTTRRVTGAVSGTVDQAAPTLVERIRQSATAIISTCSAQKRQMPTAPSRTQSESTQAVT